MQMEHADTCAHAFWVARFALLLGHLGCLHWKDLSAWWFRCSTLQQEFTALFAIMCMQRKNGHGQILPSRHSQLRYEQHIEGHCNPIL